MKAFKVNPTAVAATFSREELSALGIGGDSITSEDAYTLGRAAFLQLGEQPRRFCVRAYVSDVSLLLFAEEAPEPFRLPN